MRKLRSIEAAGVQGVVSELGAGAGVGSVVVAPKRVCAIVANVPGPFSKALLGRSNVVSVRKRPS